MSAWAFFDVDGTLINTRSLISFLPRLAALPGMDAARYAAYWDGLRERVRGGLARDALNAYWFSVLEGLPVAAVEAAGRAWFAEQSTGGGFYNAQGQALLRQSRDDGAQVCLVTGSCPALVRPLAEALGIADVLCSVPQAYAGRYTGMLDGLPCIGQNKATAVRTFALQRGIDLNRCLAVGDDPTDRPMMDAVGLSVLVATEPRYAAEWRELFPPEPAAAAMTASKPAEDAVHG